MSIEIKKENLKEVGKFLKSIRESKGMTIYQVCRGCNGNLFEATISRIESGDGYTIDKLREYCDFLGLKITISEE